MENRLSLDAEIDIPYALIDPAPWNPKTTIHGSYRRGLKASLDYLGIRDRLKLIPNSKRKGRYISIDGNQRLDVIGEHYLNILIKEHFKIPDDCSDAQFQKVMSSEENQKTIEKLKKKLPSILVPCQVMTRLNNDQAFTESDAKLLSLTWDRNTAKVDEVKQADLYREVVAEQIKSVSDANKKAFEIQRKLMVRPELPVVQPSSKPSTQPQESFKFAEPGTFTPTESEPWGPTPPNGSQSVTQAQTQQIQLVPLVFSLTPDGYEKVTDSILRSKARIFRENVLKQALEVLESLLPIDLDQQIDSIIAEVALSITNKHKEIQERIQNASSK
jgi:hypothetical protein